MTRNRRDTHHTQIVDGLRDAGYFVIILADLKHGIFDLHVVSKSRARLTCLMEIKTPGEHLTDDEEKFAARYPGEKTIVFSLEEAKAHMAILDELEAL